jgi:hypothetical protein
VRGLAQELALSDASQADRLLFAQRMWTEESKWATSADVVLQT